MLLTFSNSKGKSFGVFLNYKTQCLTKSCSVLFTLQHKSLVMERDRKSQDETRKLETRPRIGKKNSR